LTEVFLFREKAPSENAGRARAVKLPSFHPKKARKNQNVHMGAIEVHSQSKRPGDQLVPDPGKFPLALLLFSVCA